MACGVLRFLTETSNPHQKGSQKVPKSADIFDAFCEKTSFYATIETRENIPKRSIND
jgi:hypothetical protein